MTVPLMQTSFAAGELAPALRVRVDLAKYHSGATLARNFFVMAQGGMANRPGTRFVGACKDSSHPVRLIPFVFSVTQSYVLEFGHLYMRVIQDGGYVLEPEHVITFIDLGNGNDYCLTIPGHNFAVGDEIQLRNLPSIPRLNEQRFLVHAVLGNWIGLRDRNGAEITGINAFGHITESVAARVYTLETPYTGEEVALLKYAQSADVLTLCHPDHPPADLKRTQHWVWTLTPITFGTQLWTPTTVSVSVSTTGDWHYSYCVTLATDKEESLPSILAVGTGAALGNDVKATIVWDHLLNDALDFDYLVYKANPVKGEAVPEGALHGYIGRCMKGRFVDNYISPDFTKTPPRHDNPFANGNHPGSVGYHQQRKMFAGSKSHPQTVWMTQPGNFANMDTTSPTQDDDAITATLASQQVNGIVALVPMNDLVVLTRGGAWRINGGASGGAITPSSIDAQPQSNHGASDLPPIVINFDILHGHVMGGSVRALSYNFYASIWTGVDVTLLANHLFVGHRIVDWCFADEPWKLIWAVREDGVLLSFLYLKEQEIIAWCHHDTHDGAFKSVASIPEGGENAVYFVVERTIDGVTNQYVERLASRLFLTNGQTDFAKTWFVDCGADYHGTPVQTLHGLDHLEGETVAVLADGHVLEPRIVTGGAIHLDREASDIIVGLPIQAQLETLPLEHGEPTLQGRRKRVSAITARLENSRGVKIGLASNGQGGLTEFKERFLTVDPGAPLPLFTGDERVRLPGGWDGTGALMIQQDQPLPCTVLAVIPEVTVSDAPT
ncbi:MAG: hypothetical protein HQM01_08255 [Magnetococcales bacterium]|nr:hypothetical protein [Magnetococcales bacterium]